MKTRLSSKQIKVLDELFGKEQILDEEEVLERNGVKAGEYRRWLKKKSYVREYEARMEALSRRRRLLINRCATFATAKLIGLIESENEETARKACLDIIGRIRQTDGGQVQNVEDKRQNEELKNKNEELKEDESSEVELTAKQAEKILESLA